MGVHQRDAGVLFATKAVKALCQRATRRGCDVAAGTRVAFVTGDNADGLVCMHLSLYTCARYLHFESYVFVGTNKRITSRYEQAAWQARATMQQLPNVESRATDAIKAHRLLRASFNENTHTRERHVERDNEPRSARALVYGNTGMHAQQLYAGARAHR